VRELLQQLQTTLGEQAEAHRALGPLLSEEKDALVHLRVDDIHACAKRKAVIASRLQRLEAERERLVNEIAGLVGLHTRPVRLIDLIAALPPAERGSLPHLREDLIAAVAEAGESQSRNRTLTERFMRLLNDSMEAVNAAFAGVPLYTTRGKVGQAALSGRVLSQRA
jgi:flagellar biosynthesis/type III secretory pathway chaperone